MTPEEKKELAEWRKHVDTALVSAIMTPEKIEDIAEKASDKAVIKMQNDLYQSVGKKTLQVIGVLIIGLAIWLHDLWLPKMK